MILSDIKLCAVSYNNDLPFKTAIKCNLTTLYSSDG